MNMKTMQKQERKSEHKTNCIEIIRIRLFVSGTKFFQNVHFVVKEKFLKRKTSVDFSSIKR